MQSKVSLTFFIILFVIKMSCETLFISKDNSIIYFYQMGYN